MRHFYTVTLAKTDTVFPYLNPPCTSLSLQIEGYLQSLLHSNSTTSPPLSLFFHSLILHGPNHHIFLIQDILGLAKVTALENKFSWCLNQQFTSYLWQHPSTTAGDLKKKKKDLKRISAIDAVFHFQVRIDFCTPRLCFARAQNETCPMEKAIDRVIPRPQTKKKKTHTRGSSQQGRHLKGQLFVYRFLVSLSVPLCGNTEQKHFSDLLTLESHKTRPPGQEATQ